MGGQPIVTLHGGGPVGGRSLLLGFICFRETSTSNGRWSRRYQPISDDVAMDTRLWRHHTLSHAVRASSQRSSIGAVVDFVVMLAYSMDMVNLVHSTRTPHTQHTCR